MKAYNIYYKNEKINRCPLNENDIKKIYGCKTIEKKTIAGTNIIIPVKDCRIIQFTLI